MREITRVNLDVVSSLLSEKPQRPDPWRLRRQRFIAALFQERSPIRSLIDHLRIQRSTRCTGQLQVGTRRPSLDRCRNFTASKKAVSIAAPSGCRLPHSEQLHRFEKSGPLRRGVDQAVFGPSRRALHRFQRSGHHCGSLTTGSRVFRRCVCACVCVCVCVTISGRNG